MAPHLTFVSSFLPGAPCLSRHPTRNHHTTCAPRMRLLSHEKLEDIPNPDDGKVAKYKLEIEIPAPFSKQKRRESIQEMKKHIDIPGFRKGTIPSFMMNELLQFVLRDCVEEMVDEAIEELNLERLNDEKSQIDYDFKTMKSVGKTEGADDLEDMITTDLPDKAPEMDLDEAKAEFAKTLKEEMGR